MGARGNELPLVQHQDPVGVHHRADPLRYHHGGDSLQMLPNTAAEIGVGFIVQR